MKKFNELSLNITEEEYRNNGRFHYSDISGYMKDGFSYFKKDRKEESESLTFGSMVDCLVTEGLDVFNDKYCVERNFNVSDNQKLVINDLTHFWYDRLEDIPPQTIVEAVRGRDLYKNYKDDSKIVAKMIEDCANYYRFIKESNGKIAVDFESFNDAKDVANILLTSETTSGFFGASKYKSVDKFFQLKFNGVIDNIPVTCMVDAIYIDHDMKKIWPIDLKTTCANFEWEFPKSFVKYHYYTQAQLYSRILRQIMDADEDYRDYELMGFTFIYISRQNKTPLLWTFENCLIKGDVTLELQDGKKIILEDFEKPLHEMYTIITEQRTVPLDISLMYGNDVIEHLKKVRI